MNSRLSVATWLMWLALPFTAIDYGRVWERLPQRMATHFDAQWRANGWTAREASFEFALLVVLFMLVVFTAVNFAIRRSSAPSIVAWIMLAFACGVLIFVLALNHWVLRYNLGERTSGPFSGESGPDNRGAMQQLGPIAGRGRCTGARVLA